MLDAIIEAMTSPKDLAVLALGLAVISLAFGFTSLVCFGLGSNRVFQCNSCGERWCYMAKQSQVLQSMREAGWATLPGDVQYCPLCRDDVLRRLTTSIEINFVPPAVYDPTPNPYQPT